MKQSYLAMTVVVAVAAGMLGSVGTFAMTDNEANTASLVDSTEVGFNGHIVLVVKDADGNIKEYQQTDNLVTASGKKCAMEHLFGVVTTCPTSIGDFTAIALTVSDFGIGVEPATANMSDITAAGLGVSLISGNGFDRGTGGVTNSLDPTGVTDGIVEISKTFTAGAAQSVVSAALYETTGSTLFAAKAFDATVDLAIDDTLTVFWNITIG